MGFDTVKMETICRYDFKKLQNRIGILRAPVELALKSFFYISDKNNRGMFINGFFRKSSYPPSNLLLYMK